MVFDQTGAVVPGTTVHIYGPQGEYTAKTDASGRYEVNGLVPGAYKVVLEAAGFKKFVSERNQVTVDHTSSLDIHLELGAASETVQVDAGAVQIDTETTSLNAPISDELYQSLPVTRNVSTIFSLAPGVVTGGGTGTANPSIGGATGLENLYLVDGVTITDQAFGGLGTYNRFFGSLGTGVNLAFIKEVDVKTGAFEPKYGRADGGIVEIVTKSGSSRFHGAIGAYLGPGDWYATRMQPYQFGWVNFIQPSLLKSPQYDLAVEAGGPVPGLKGKMFFFGAFDPTLNQDVAFAPPGTPLRSHGPYTYSTTTMSWAAKLTWVPLDFMQIEASSFGDPSRHNQIPGPTWQSGLTASNADSVGTGYRYGSMDSVARVSASPLPSWTILGYYTYNFNHFDQTPLFDRYTIQDRSVTPFTTAYIGSYEPTRNNDYSLNIETEKKFNFFGEHTIGLGYSYDHTNFLDKPTRTGSLFAIPGGNAAGEDFSQSGYLGSHQDAVGQMTNATFRLKPALNSDGSPSTTCTYCAQYHGQEVYLQQIRGTYKGLSVLATSRYHTLWANDSYHMNRYLTVNAGLRWEEQWYAGTVLKYLFNDNWSPRVGFNLDPFGSGRTKVFFNYARYQLVLPLDAAIRQLGNEQDDTSFYFEPQTDSKGNAVTDELGAVIPVLDAAHTLNNTTQGAGSTFGKPSFASSTGEGILPTTKMEYENEYVLGVQREIMHGTVVQARYSDRRLGRIVEDIGSQSPEGSLIDHGYWGGIANVLATTDVAVNEDHVDYTADQWNAAYAAATQNGKNPLTAANYIAPAAGCTYANDTSVANGGLFKHYDGTPFGGTCIPNYLDAGNGGSDGKPDGFAKPVRRYQEMVVEANRNFKNHWQGRANYRWAKLWGNYEGLFRNDNGQSDPGISSLFDFTQGSVGLLGDQFKPGYLNTDRRNVLNVNVAWTASKDSFLAKLDKMTFGTNVRAASGNPLSAYASHPIYLNTGEVPIGGRGTKGRMPSTLQFDGHMDYPYQFHERYTLKLAFDAFNLFNAQKETGKSQNLDLSPGAPSVDYGKPTAFQGPFYARASIRLEF
ncbi:MAG TPA: carboxypeptidase regulatory-like domain-containing protein [Terracidiphilus sp.]